jgi:hypothetical protein
MVKLWKCSGNIAATLYMLLIINTVCAPLHQYVPYKETCVAARAWAIDLKN